MCINWVQQTAVAPVKEAQNVYLQYGISATKLDENYKLDCWIFIILIFMCAFVFGK